MGSATIIDPTVIDPEGHAVEEWRPGVTTRMQVSAEIGSNQLCIFEQWCEPGLGAPMHFHAVEEVLTVLSGTAEVSVDRHKLTVRDGQSVVVPPGIRHGFVNISDTQLHVRAILAAPVFEAAYDDARESPRRWLPTAPSSSN